MRRTARQTLAAAAALPPLERYGPRRRVRWTQAHEDLLGGASDEALADVWNIFSDQVWRRRNQLRRLPYGTTTATAIRWTRAMIRELGVLTDKAFAQRHGMAKASAALKRTSMGIPQAPHPSRCRWTPAMVALLGRHTDLELMQRFGMVAGTIRAKREELGIPCFRKTKIDWTSARVRRLMGRLSDIAVARRLGVNSETVRLRRTEAGIPPHVQAAWTPDAWRRLGTVPDSVIAAEVGLTRSAVSWNRRRLGIPAWDTRPHPPRRR
jgi:hypothetical protein